MSIWEGNFLKRKSQEYLKKSSFVKKRTLLVLCGRIRRLLPHSLLFVRPAKVFLLYIFGHPRRWYLLCATDLYETYTMTSATGRNKIYEYITNDTCTILKLSDVVRKNIFLNRNNEFHQTNLISKEIYMINWLWEREPAMIDTMQIVAKNQVGMIIDEYKKLSGFQSTVLKYK